MFIRKESIQSQGFFLVCDALHSPMASDALGVEILSAGEEGHEVDMSSEEDLEDDGRIEDSLDSLDESEAFD